MWARMASGFRLELHVEATLMAHNRVRYGRHDSGQEAYAARLKEEARRFFSVSGVLSQRAAERASAEQAPARLHHPFRRKALTEPGVRCIVSLVAARASAIARGLAAGG